MSFKHGGGLFVGDFHLLLKIFLFKEFPKREKYACKSEMSLVKKGIKIKSLKQKKGQKLLVFTRLRQKQWSGGTLENYERVAKAKEENEGSRKKEFEIFSKKL